MRRFLMTFLFAILSTFIIGTLTANAATWYVNPTGGGTGASSTDPTDIHTAVSNSVVGDNIILSAGTYALSSEIEIKDHDITITGAGIGSTIFDCTTPGECFFIDTTSITSNTVLADFSIQNASITGILINGDAAPTIDGMSFENNSCGVMSTDGTPIIINSEFVSNNYGISAILDGIPSLVSGNLFDSNTNYGILLTDAYKGESIIDNIFTENRTGIQLITGGVDTNLVIKHNLFTNNSLYGLFLGGSSNATYSVYDNSTVEDNDFQENPTGLMISGVLTPTYDYWPTYMNTHVDSNTFSLNTYGIQLYEANATVTNNLVQTSTMGGIKMNGGSNDIAYNTIVNSSHYDLQEGGNGSSYIVNNIFYGYAPYGFWGFSTSSAAQLGYNDSYGHTSSDYYGTYASLGGNISVDPFFVSNSNFRLRMYSPLINYAALYFTPKDLGGNLRDSLTGIRRPEIGAYEFRNRILP